jgi:hypothetical protein
MDTGARKCLMGHIGGMQRREKMEIRPMFFTRRYHEEEAYSMLTGKSGHPVSTVRWCNRTA